jgi:uncharacterized membrane protein YqjE
MTQGPEPEMPEHSSWRESAVEFVSARVELLSLEAKEAGKLAAIKVALIVFAICCLRVAWLVAVAGLIGWIASGTGSWYFVALGAAGFHVLLAVVAALILRRPAPPAFPHSKAELLKDREWLLHNNEISKR